MELNLFLIGLSHKTTPLDLREKMTIPQDQVADNLHSLMQHEEICEVMILSTCNRTEIYAVSEDVQKGLAILSKKFAQWATGIEDKIGSFLYKLEGSEAMRHFFRVASSLDAMVVGEAQILGQVREAYLLAEGAGTIDTVFHYLAPKAFNIAKKIRTDTEIARHPVSISYVAVQLADKIFGDLSEKSVLLVGAGEMVKLAALHFQEKKIADLFVTNRTDERAEQLSKEFHAMAVPFDDFLSQMSHVDIVITSTSSDTYLIVEKDIHEVMRQRKNKTMFLIDIAVPRNIDPRVNHISNVYLYDLDDLQGIVDENLIVRQKEAQHAEEIITKELGGFVQYLHQQSMAPTISQLSKKFEDVRRKEVEKLLTTSLNWTEEQKKAVEEGTQAIKNKFLHDPIMTLKTDGIKEEGHRTIDFIKKLFRLDGE